MTTAKDNGKIEIPQTLQELLQNEDAVAADLRSATAGLLDLVADFERKHAVLMQRRGALESRSASLRSKISTVQTAVKRLTFPAHMARLGELLRDFVDDNTDIVAKSVAGSGGADGADANVDAVPSELMRFAATTTNGAPALEDEHAVGLAPMTREQQIKFASLFVEGGVMESKGCDELAQQYFRHAGRQAPAPLPLTKCDNPDEVLLDQAFVPFVAAAASASAAAAGGELRKRSPLTDITVMRCPAVGGRVLVSKRDYEAGNLVFVESPFLTVTRSTTALLPTLPPLLQRVVRDMLALPQAQAAMRRQGWDTQLVNCVLTYLSMQTLDSMARGENADQKQQQQQQQQQGDENGNWMWRSPAPLFRFASGDYCGEDAATKRRMRKLLFLGAPLQSMDAGAVHQLHKFAKFVFAALPPCYRDFEGDDTATRAACAEWARRGLTAAFDHIFDNNDPNTPNPTVTMTPYDDNPAHRQIAVSPIGRESCLAPDSSGAVSAAAAASQNETEAALQLPPECRVSVSDIVRIFAVCQTNSVNLLDDRAFMSSTVSAEETAAGRALGTAAQLPAPAQRSGLFALMSMLEHSCCPNVAWCPSSSSSASSTAGAAGAGTGAGAIELRALRRIVPGERLKVAYVPPVLPAQQRRERLKRQFHFVCSCEACTGTDWSRAVVDASRGTCSVPLSITGDWVDLSTAAAGGGGGGGGGGGKIDARASVEAAARVRAEMAAYGEAAEKQKQKQKQASDENDVEDDDNEDEDEDEDATELIAQPYKLVCEELDHVEKLFSLSSSSSDVEHHRHQQRVHPAHVAAYLHCMRLCTAWAYLLVASAMDWKQQHAVKVAPLSTRVRTALVRATATYVRCVLGERSAETVLLTEALGAFGVDVAASTSNLHLPSIPRSVYLYAAVVPMIESVSFALTLEEVAISRLGDAEQQKQQKERHALLKVAELWQALVALVEKHLGFDKSPYAAKYRLYCANPTQCLLAPTEQPLA